LDLAVAATRVASQLQGLAAVLVAEADAADASLQEAGVSTGSFLAGKTRLSSRQATSVVFQARRLESLPAGLWSSVGWFDQYESCPRGIPSYDPNASLFYC
jgi:hypothetical protein